MLPAPLHVPPVTRPSRWAERSRAGRRAPYTKGCPLVYDRPGSYAQGVLDLLLDPGGLVHVGVTGLLLLVIWLGLLAMKVVAFVDCLRHPAGAFPSAGKRSRTLWLVVTGLSLAFHLVSSPLNFVNLAGTIGSGIYLVDVRPALRQVRGWGGSGRSKEGPYGPW